MIGYPSDPILPQVDAQVILQISDDDKINRLVGTVTQQFKAFTNISQINSGSITEKLRPQCQVESLFLHAPNATAVSSVKTFARGDATGTLWTEDEDYELVADLWHSRLDSIGALLFPAQGPGAYIEVQYTGGWASDDIPADVILGAEMMMRLQAKRAKGDVGARMKKDRDRQVAERDSRGIPREVADLWLPYRVFV